MLCFGPSLIVLEFTILVPLASYVHIDQRPELTDLGTYRLFLLTALFKH